jgi:hypothetical protein
MGPHARVLDYLEIRVMGIKQARVSISHDQEVHSNAIRKLQIRNRIKVRRRSSGRNDYVYANQQKPGPEQYSQGGYEASYGSYTVDEQAHTFTFHVEGALVRSLIGKDLLRAFEISGNRMIVKSVRADEHWRVTWERYNGPESKSAD